MMMPNSAHQQRRNNQHHPVVEAEVRQSHPREDGAHHVERAVREVDDVQQSEDDRQAQRQHRVERAVDEPEQQLAQQGRQGDAEQLGHGVRRGRGMKSSQARAVTPTAHACPSSCYSSAHFVPPAGAKATSPGIVCATLK